MRTSGEGVKGTKEELNFLQRTKKRESALWDILMHGAGNNMREGEEVQAGVQRIEKPSKGKGLRHALHACVTAGGEKEIGSLILARCEIAGGKEEKKRRTGQKTQNLIVLRERTRLSMRTGVDG